MGTLALWGLAAIVGGALALGVGKTLLPKGNAGAGAGGAVPVALEAVKERPFIERIEAIATSRSNEEVTLTAKISETVRSVSFTDGQTVKAGDILVELTNAEQSANLAAAQTARDEAAKNFERVTRLAASGYVSPAQLDAARTARDNAQGRVDALASQLSDRVIRAPFDGIAGLRYVSPGTLVRPGDVITTVADVSAVKLDFPVPEVNLASLKTGLPIEAHTADYPGVTFTGTIQAIDARIDQATRTIAARALVPNADGRLRGGMSMSVDIIRSSKSALAIPERAIIALRDQLFAFRVVNGKSAQTPIKTGVHGDGYAEITEGLKPGDLIIVDGVQRLRDGQKVDIVSVDGNEQAPQKPAKRAGS